MNVRQITDNLYLIKLDQKPEGYRDFISAWLYMDQDITFLVDPGPLSSIDILRSALAELGVRELDYILLTHIHIDHAGGTGRLIEYFPKARVLCHPKGIPHIINPEKLWEGSLSVLGDTARVYGEIVPVPENSIFFDRIISKGDTSLEIIETPGHAVHHLSFMLDKCLFAGELAGVNVPLLNRIYTRPATPPRFILEVWQESLKKIMEKKPEALCFGHFGYTENAGDVLASAGEQLILWTDVIRSELNSGEDNFFGRVKDSLLERDPVFANYHFLDEDIKKREDDFFNNSVRGIREYVESCE